MRGPTDLILDGLDRVDDEMLRRWSARLLWIGIVAGCVNVAAFCAGFISVVVGLALVTLLLSWMALWAQFAQTVIMTDVKKSVDR